jgi:hypothetical protein
MRRTIHMSVGRDCVWEYDTALTKQQNVSQCRLTISLLMSYMYGAPSQARNFKSYLYIYIYIYMAEIC